MGRYTELLTMVVDKMKIALCLIAIVTLIGVSGATLYSIGENYSVELALIPPIGTYVEELVVNDSAGYSVTGMFTNFRGGNGGTIIIIYEESPEMFYPRMTYTYGIDMDNDTQLADCICGEMLALLDVTMLCALEGSCGNFGYSHLTDEMDIKDKIEGSNSSYAFTENPYFGFVAVVPVELETGEKSNTFGSLGAANQQINEQTLKGYIGLINWHDRIVVLSTEPASVFRTILGNLRVVQREDKGQAVLEDIMRYL